MRDSPRLASGAVAAGLRELARCAALRPLAPLPDPEELENASPSYSLATEVVVHLPCRRPDLALAGRLRARALARLRTVAGYASTPGCQRRSKRSQLWRLKMSHPAGGDEPQIVAASRRLRVRLG